MVALNNHRLTRSAFTLLVGNVGGAALSFILSVLIGRALGQDGLGVYTAALAWVFPLALVADFGLGTLLTRDLARHPDQQAAYLHTSVWARLLLGGGLMLALLLVAPVLSDNPPLITGLRLSAPLIVILPFFGLFTAVFRARHLMWPITALNLGMLVMQVILTALVFLGGGDVLAALAVNTLTSAGQLAAAWLLYRALTPASILSSTPDLHLLPLLRLAWPFALAGILAALQVRLSLIFLERLTDTAQVGYYAAAARFVEAGRIIPNALFGALFPLLASLAAQPDSLRRTFRRVTLGLVLYGCLFGLVFALLASPILNLTYGSAFAPAAPVLSIAAWSLLPGILRAALTLYLYARGREHFANVVTGVTLLVQIGLSLWLIPRYGAFGAGLVILMTETVALALLWFRRN